MKGPYQPQTVARAALLLAVGVVASGCDWTLFGYDTVNTRNSPHIGISMSTVGSLTETWTHSFATSGLLTVHDSITEAGGVVYATSLAPRPAWLYQRGGDPGGIQCDRVHQSDKRLHTPLGGRRRGHGMSGRSSVCG
jgi:hypothetical protein